MTLEAMLPTDEMGTWTTERKVNKVPANQIEALEQLCLLNGAHVQIKSFSIH